MIEFALKVLAAYAILEVIPQFVGPKPRYREFPGPLDFILGAAVLLGAILLIFPANRKPPQCRL